MRIKKGLGLSLALLVAHGQALAQRCDAYFPFDDSLADASGNGNDAQIVSRIPRDYAPQYADGRIGRALHVAGEFAFRALINLHYDVCPQVTITAWIKLESVGNSDRQEIFATGQGSGPGLYAQSPDITLNGTEYGIYRANSIAGPNTWFFVAGVYDYERGEYRLHWRGEDEAGALSEFRYGAGNSLWIGALDDDLSHMAQSLYIDDLRVIGRALTHAEVSAIETGAPAMSRTENTLMCMVHEDCATGTYCAWDGTCHPENHAPRRALVIPEIPVPIAQTFLEPGSYNFEYILGEWCGTHSYRQRASLPTRTVRVLPAQP